MRGVSYKRIDWRLLLQLVQFSRDKPKSNASLYLNGGNFQPVHGRVIHNIHLSRVNLAFLCVFHLSIEIFNFVLPLLYLFGRCLYASTLNFLAQYFFPEVKIKNWGGTRVYNLRHLETAASVKCFQILKHFGDTTAHSRDSKIFWWLCIFRRSRHSKPFIYPARIQNLSMNPGPLNFEENCLTVDCTKSVFEYKTKWNQPIFKLLNTR